MKHDLIRLIFKSSMCLAHLAQTKSPFRPGNALPSIVGGSGNLFIACSTHKRIVSSTTYLDDGARSSTRWQYLRAPAHSTARVPAEHPRLGTQRQRVYCGRRDAGRELRMTRLTWEPTAASYYTILKSGATSGSGVIQLIGRWGENFIKPVGGSGGRWSSRSGHVMPSCSPPPCTHQSSSRRSISRPLSINGAMGAAAKPAAMFASALAVFVAVITAYTVPTKPIWVVEVLVYRSWRVSRPCGKRRTTATGKVDVVLARGAAAVGDVRASVRRPLL